jgi:formaldehyde-activating enzyme involved in methanogenesis
VTIDEELTLLDSQLRRLKIEYEIYFSNPTKRPPTDVEWKVLSLLRKFSDGGRMSFSQRFRYNEIAQRYAIYSDLWRKKNRIREEGYRRPQDALLSVQGVRVQEHEPEHKVYGVSQAAAAIAAADVTPAAATSAAIPPTEEKKPFSVQCADARSERDQVQKLYQALTDAKKRSGEAVSGNLDSFTSFVQKKTDQIRKQYGCEAVEYTVEMQNGQVKLKAKAKT